MIAWLQGKIIDNHQPGKLVIDVQGVGYDVETSLQSFFEVATADSVGLHIHTVVREDAFLLYGFLHKQERALFRALIKVNGIGPKSAMAILSSITPADFVHCIQSDNADLLTKIPGVGKKTAQRLLVEMRDSLKDFAASEGIKSADNISLATAKAHEEAVSALVALGYKLQEATRVIRKLDDGEKSCEQLIRQALQVL